MKLFAFCVFLFPFIALYPQDWCQSELKTSLERFYRYENDQLIDYQGNSYTRIKFNDDFHENAACLMKDPDQAKILSEAYLEKIRPFVTDEVDQAFKKALIKMCILFGSEKVSLEEGLFWGLRGEEGDAYDWALRHKEEVRSFLKQANKQAQSVPFKEKDLNRALRVVITMTTASGGNDSVANAIKGYLETLPNIECILIDSEELAREADPIMLATGQITYDGVYAKYFQKKNQGVELFLVRDDLTKELGKFIPSKLNKNLKNKVRELEPDLILSTRSYNIDDLSLATLGIPFRMIHCDYELSFFLLGLFDKTPTEMVKYWLPSLEATVFKPLFQSSERMDLYDADDDIETVFAKVSLITGRSISELSSQFILSGYPVSHDFYQAFPLEVEKMRKKWGVEKGETPVLICMGKNGVGVLEEIFNRISTQKRSGFKYIFVTGKNVELKEKLEKRNESQICLLGLVSPSEMNELMNICPVTISKPGGAFVSEAMNTTTYLLITSSHPWEEANGNIIEKLGFGHRSPSLDLLQDEIEGVLQKTLHKPPKKVLEHWKQLLDEELKKFGLGSLRALT